MTNLAFNRFSTSIPTVRITDILTDDNLTKGINGETTSQANTDLITNLIIGRDYFNDSECHLVIDNFPNLEKILVKPNYLNKIESITICNNEKLKRIEVEDSYSSKGSFNIALQVTFDNTIIFFKLENNVIAAMTKVGN